MEAEQPTSQLRKMPSVAIIPSNDVFNLLNNHDSLYKLDKTGLIFQEIISKLRQQIESLSNLKSYSFLNFNNDFFRQPVWRTLEKLISFGLIDGEGVFINPERYNDTPWFYRIDIFPKYPDNVTDGVQTRMPIGHGFGKNPTEVCSKAIGEFLERYVLLLYHKAKLIRGSLKSFKEKNVPTIDLSLLAGFSDEQKRWDARLQFNEESLFRWERAQRLSSGEEVYVPAQLIFWNYIRDELEPYLCEGNTNGAGGWFSKGGAILSGLYELIQRDSFLIYWLNGLTPIAIDPKTIPNDDFQNLLEESERYGFEIHCLDVTADTGVPAFAVIVSDPSGKSPRFCLGGGCQADPAKALHRALEEAWSVYYWMRPRPSYPALGKNYQPFREKIGQDERLRLWANPEMADYFKFFISGRKESFASINFDYPKEFASQKEELDFLVKRVENLGPGYEVYYYQLRHPFLSEVGYCSAQVIVPQFIPLYIHEINAPLGSRRLKEVSPKLEFKAAKEFNPLPHPFP